MRIIDTLSGEGFASRIIEHDDGRVAFLADADIDADGAPHAYHPRNLGLDDLINARDHAGNYVGILTDRHGKPLVQDSSDPAPGFFISTTTYQFRDRPLTSQRRYLDAEKVPFIVVPPIVVTATRGIVMGCQASVTDTRSGRKVWCLVGDRGPRTKTGELSIAAARELAIPFNPRNGGIDAPVFLYELWPGSPALVKGQTYELQAA